MEQSIEEQIKTVAKFMCVFMEVTMKPNEWQKGNSLLEVTAKYDEPFIYIPPEMRHISPSDNVDDIRNEALRKSWERVAWNAKYHTSWDWLMPACKKFDSLNLLDKEYESLCDEIDNAVSCYEIMPAFKNLVKAITWYSSTQQK